MITRLLAWWQGKRSGIGDEQVNSGVLREGMGVKFTLAPSKLNPNPRSVWLGGVLRKEDKALSLAAEWEPEFPGQLAPAFPAVGESLALTVTGTQGLYCFMAPIRDIRQDTEFPNKCLIVIALPLLVTKVQRRRTPRRELTLPATIEPAEKPAGSLPQHGTVRDFSSGGLRADIGNVVTVSDATRLVETYKAGTLLRIRLPLPLLPGEGILARVRSCERTARRGGLGVRIACEFLPMPDFDLDLLTTHLS